MFWHLFRTPTTPVDLQFSGCSVDDLRRVVDTAPAYADVSLGSKHQRLTLRARSVMPTHHGRVAAVSRLVVTESAGPVLNLHGETRPGRASRWVTLGLGLTGLGCAGLGLLLLVGTLDAVGLLLLGAFLLLVAWCLRGIERGWVADSAEALTHPDGWLPTGLRTGQAGARGA